MMVSLVVATLGRTAELGRLLDSLGEQTHAEFEVVIVDQNPDDRLTELLQRHAGVLRLRHLRSEPGLSRARNVALRAVDGELIGFPDDDCWYEPELLSRVVEFFRARPEAALVSGRAVAPDGSDAVGRFHQTPGPITRSNIWHRCTSTAMFVRREAATAAGGFDEGLGVGAGTPWMAGEDIDFPLRVMAAGYTAWFEPGRIVVGHPSRARPTDAAAIRRAAGYAAGMGRVLSKHRFPAWFVGYYLARSLGGSLHALARGDLQAAAYHRAVLGGRWRGWRGHGAGNGSHVRPASPHAPNPTDGPAQ